MEDIQTNGGAAGESSCLVKREEIAMMQMVETDSEGYTDLGSESLQALESGDADGFWSSIDLLGQFREMDMPNKKNNTAIAKAEKYFDIRFIEYMKHTSAHRLRPDYYPGDSDFTVRECLMRTYPDLEPLLPAPLMESLDSSDRDIKLLSSLQHDKYEMFSENLGSENPNPSYNEP